MVAESGEHEMGGLTGEAGWLISNGLGWAGKWENISFGASFTNDPVVLASVMSYNGLDAVTTRLRNLDFSGFSLAMDEQESKHDGHVYELLGWIALEAGTGTTTEGRKLDVFFEPINHALTPVRYTNATSHRQPTVMSDVDSTFGGDPVYLRYANPTHSQIELKLTEEKGLRPRDQPPSGGRWRLCRRIGTWIRNRRGCARPFPDSSGNGSPTGISAHNNPASLQEVEPVRASGRCEKAHRIARQPPAGIACPGSTDSP
jgi:hypothetical protein